MNGTLVTLAKVGHGREFVSALGWTASNALVRANISTQLECILAPIGGEDRGEGVVFQFQFVPAMRAATAAAHRAARLTHTTLVTSLRTAFRNPAPARRPFAPTHLRFVVRTIAPPRSSPRAPFQSNPAPFDSFSAKNPEAFRSGYFVTEKVAPARRPFAPPHLRSVVRKIKHQPVPGSSVPKQPRSVWFIFREKPGGFPLRLFRRRESRSGASALRAAAPPLRRLSN